MIEINIPGRGNFNIENLVLDLNGTLALDGKIIEGVKERLRTLCRQLDTYLVTADTRGRAEETLNDINADKADRKGSFSIRLHRIGEGEEDFQKLEFVQKLIPDKTMSIGNGSNDALMLKESAIGICIVGKEGAAAEALMNADLVIIDINDALDLLLKPARLMATLRK